MFRLTARLHCDRCGVGYSEPLEFDDEDRSAQGVLSDKRRQARNDGWELVRAETNALKDWCPTCLEKHFAEMKGGD